MKRILAAGGVLTGAAAAFTPALAQNQPEKPAAASPKAEKNKAEGKEKEKAKEEEDTEIPLSDVPPEVRKAAEAAAPKVKFESAYRDEENKQVTYELVGEDEDEREVTVSVSGEGKVEHVDTEIALEDVPEVVQSALKKKFPRFVPSTVYEVKQEGKVAAYQYEGKRPKDKEEIAIFVSPDGKETDIDES